MTTKAIFIDPSSDHFLGDRLFDIEDKFLNRDGTLLPFSRLRDYYSSRNITIHTADKLRDGSARCDINYYYSFGKLNGYEQVKNDPQVKLSGFILMEPPLIKPHMYAALPALTADFEFVYLHNCIGDGYSLRGVNVGKLKKFNWPQPYNDVLIEYWDRIKRKNKLVAIAGNHNPLFRKPELYSERIKAIAELGTQRGVDLFGRGWAKWWSPHACWWSYWRYRQALMASYHGGCDSKLETLSRYRFSLCFENMPMIGYLTEKIFDCFYAGTVPVYWGAPDIDRLVPAAAYVDMRKFKSYEDMYSYICGMSDVDWQNMREAAREFLKTDGAKNYYHGLAQVIDL
jgi:hypothetical protein